MQIQNAIITGSFSYNGADLSNVTSSNAYSASLSSRTTNLETTSSVLVGASSSFSSILSSVSSSQQQLSSSFLTLTASFNAVSASQQQISASYIALSASYNVFSGSASTRTTQIEQVYATTGSNSFRANQSITGSLVVSSTITAQTLVVQTVTSSIVYSSGSNIFGCDLNSRQTFTGSVLITGSLTIAGASSATSYSGATIFGSTIACSPIGCFATSCATAFIGGTMSGTTIYGSTAVCSAVGKFTSCIDAGSGTFSGQLNVCYASYPEQRITDGTIGYQMYSSTGASDFVVGTYTNHNLIFRTNQVTRLSITNAGTSVFAGQVCAPTLIASTCLAVRAGTATVVINAIAGAASNNHITLQRNDTQYASIGLNGSDDFTIFGTSTSCSRLTIDNSGEVSVYNYFHIRNASQTALYLNNTDRAGGLGRQWSILNGNLGAGIFSIKDETAACNRLTIDTLGNLTIGTNFQIDAAGDFYQKTTGAGQISAAIANVTYPTYGFYGNTGVGMYRESSNTLAFTTCATKRLTITSAGIVQIGSTAGSSGMFLTTGDAGITCNNTYFGTGQVRIGGGSDAGANTVLSIAPGVVSVDAPGVSGGRFKLSEVGTLGINCTGVAARTMVVKGATGCYIVAEFIEPAGVHSIELYPNKNCTNHISSDYMSGGTFLPLSLSGRECTTDLVLGTNGRVGIGSGANNGILTVYESGCTVSLGISCFCNQAKGIEIYNANSGTTNNVVGLWISTGPHKVGIASGRTCAETTWEVDLRFYTHPTTIGTLDGTCENMRLYGDGSLVTRAGASSPGLYSDINLKENLSIIPSALNKIQCINGYTFDWKDTAPSRSTPDLLNIIHDAGLIAQEVEEIMPDIVRNNDLSCIKMLNYNGITALLVEGMKEQQCTICTQATMINTLKTCLGIA